MEEDKKPQTITEYFGTTPERSQEIAIELDKLVTLGKSLIEIIEHMKNVKNLTHDEMCGFLWSLGFWFGKLQVGEIQKELDSKPPVIIV